MSEAKQLSRADYLNSVGAKLFTDSELEPARLHFLAALSVEPEHAMALQNLGAALRQMRHYAASEVIAMRSVAASGGAPHCLSNLGVAQLMMRKYKEALATFRTVVAAEANFPQIWHNYGLVLYMMGRHKEALTAFERSLALAPENNTVQSDRALAMLSLGRIADGLAAYEVRWKLLAKSCVWNLNVPEWQGEQLKGCRILVHHEQGFGDSLMLVRFVKSLAMLGPHITLAVPEELRQLFAQSFPFIKVMALEDEELTKTKFDYHTPLLSLMRHLDVQEPKDVTSAPYLCDGPMRLKLPGAGFKIGLCWASGNHGPMSMERRRLVPITSFLPLVAKAGVSLFSLQKGVEIKDIANNGLEGIVYDLAPRLDNFAMTASAIAGLDLVISVDSAVAHLAGAMGKPTIMLSPYTRCWRWWGESEGWPWYEGMKILPQSEDGMWDVAVSRAVAMATKFSRVVRPVAA